jgi:hypothetical protein
MTRVEGPDAQHSRRFDRLRELLLINEMEVDMKVAVPGALTCIAIVPIASAETGGYPASPSHAIVGTNPDGTPRYGASRGGVQKLPEAPLAEAVPIGLTPSRSKAKTLPRIALARSARASRYACVNVHGDPGDHLACDRGLICVRAPRCSS